MSKATRWVYKAYASCWQDINSGAWGHPLPGDYYLDCDEWRVWK